MSRREIASWRLRGARFLDGVQSLPDIAVIRIQVERDPHLFFGVFQFSSVKVHPSEVLVQMRGFRARATKLNRLLDLRERLRPVLCVGRREREISELLHTIRNL